MDMRFAGFDRDDGNIEKCQKHGVSIEEIEALFSSVEFTVFEDDFHSVDEHRLRMIGRNPGGRFIFLGFTIRMFEGEDFVRVFTARYMRKKEIDNYAQKETSRTEN